MTHDIRLSRLAGLSILISTIVSAVGSAQAPCEPGAAGASNVERAGSSHFIVLAGRSGRFYDRSGPAFAMLIEMAGREAKVDALGIYEAGGQPVFGAVPEQTYREFLREPVAASDVMLRLRITDAQYERGLRILRTWDRRVREGALLYPDVFMDNILVVKQVTEDLNRCGEETVKLYALDWGLEDDISERNLPPHIP